MANESDYERGLIARVFYRRGGRKISETFVEAKALGVTSEWFVDPQSRNVWKGAENLFEKEDFESIQPTMIIRAANAVAATERDDVLHHATVDKAFFDKSERSVDGTDTIDSYVKVLRDLHVARKCGAAFQKASDAFAGGVDSASVVAALVSEVQGTVSTEASRGRISVADMVDEVIAKYKEAHHQVCDLGNVGYTPGIPLPWKKLTYTLNGFATALTILAARPGVGKTSLAVEIMRFWMDMGYKVVFNSLDMSGPELLKRQLAEQSQVSSRKLQFGKSTKEEWEKYDLPALLAAGERMKDLERSGLYTLYSEHDADILKANVKILKDQGKIDVLVVDYIQLMTCHGMEKGSRQQMVTRVSNILHEITVKIGVPVLALAQINRDSAKEGSEPQAHDLKDSGAIEQDATNILILHPNMELKKKWNEVPPAQFMSNPNSPTAAKALMPMWLMVPKARDGDAGTRIPMLVVQNKYSWYQADCESDTKDGMWDRVWDNWKHDSIEKTWERNGALMRSDVDAIIAAKNMELAAKAHTVDVEDVGDTHEPDEPPQQTVTVEEMPF